MAAALAIVGPTAAGKSALALELARLTGRLEIVSVDAMQVYRGMDIGTAKPTRAEQREVPHHLIDVADPSSDFSFGRYLGLARAAIAEIEARRARPVLVGGTGLYVRGLVDDLDVPGRWPDVRAELEADPDTIGLHRRLVDLDAVAAGRMDPGNRRRVLRALEVTIGSGRPFSSFGPGLDAYPPRPTMQVGLDLPIAELDARIASRVRSMVDRGLVEEVRALAAAPGGLSRTARQALGYREVLEHLELGTPLEVAIGETVARTRRFARRQLRWFRRDPRITWLDARQEPGDLARSVARQ
jgi:tRNA dimethylallyltransferase